MRLTLSRRKVSNETARNRHGSAKAEPDSGRLMEAAGIEPASEVDPT